jgi:hypothetical protein
MTISEVDSKESGLTYGLTYGMTTVNIRFNIIFTAFSNFCYVGQIHNIRQLTSADVRYESEHFLPPRKKLAHSNTYSSGG